MMQKHRISTNIGKDQKITVELKQDFDILEILSLKFTQQDMYTSMCSDYGVVCGRITANNGFGLGNVRISIFIPLSDEDVDDPVISKLYPYTSTNDLNEDGYRYNLLPKRQQHGGHEATGTFPDQSDILGREEQLEVFEKYYKFTVKTNPAGDFMIWGVPVGTQTIHVDADLSDIGCFSLRPNDFIRQGVGSDQFKTKYAFKASEDLNSLPQIVSFDKTIQVYPFWGNEEFCEIGITRTDFDLSDRGVEIRPKAYLIGGVFTDSGKNSINKNCTPRRKMGRKCDMEAKSAKIDCIRFTDQKDEFNQPYLEYLQISEDVPDDGGFVLPIAMNTEFVITNEFGENEITNDPNKGIPTAACYRFRFNLNDSGLARVRQNADYLIPNIREYANQVDKSYAFSTNLDDYPADAKSLILNNQGGQFFPQDYFYRLTYNKVYTVSSYHESYFGDDWLGRIGFANINDAHPGEEDDCGDKLTPPTNFGRKHWTFSLLIAEILLFFDYAIKTIVLQSIEIITDVISFFAEVVIDLGGTRSLRGYKNSWIYDNQSTLKLVTYPDCEECSEGEFGWGGTLDQTNDKFYPTQENNCTYFDVPYDDNIINGYFVKPRPIDDLSKFPTVSFYPSWATTDNLKKIYLNPGLYKSEVPGSVQSQVCGFVRTDWNDNSATPELLKVQRVYVRKDQLLLADPNHPEYYVDEILGVGVFGEYDQVNIGLNYIAGSNSPLPGYIPAIPANWTSSETPHNPNSHLIGNWDELWHEYQEECNYWTLCITSKTDRYYFGHPMIELGYPPKSFSFRSEYRNGIFYIVPGSQDKTRLQKIINEYYRRKRVAKLFCGGIVNYGFMDSWLSGSLYFHQFKAKGIFHGVENMIKYCRNTVRYVQDQGRFYYRSAMFSNGSFQNEKINRPTTIVDLGPRDEFIKEICIDQSLDPNCSVARSIGPTSYKDLGELLGMAINYKMDVKGDAGTTEMFFKNNSFQYGRNITNVLNGDILQLLSINNEAGIEGFDLENPKYIGYRYDVLDPEFYPNLFKKNGEYGPLPVDLEYDEDGERVRLCLNEGTHIDYYGNRVQGRLTESSQTVPYRFWNKGDRGFGSSQDIGSHKGWAYNFLAVEKLQGTKSHNYLFNQIPGDSSDAYLLPPITADFDGLLINNVSGMAGNGAEFDVVILSTQTTPTGYTKYSHEYPGFTYLYVTSGTTLNPKKGTLYVRYGNASDDGTTGWAKYTGWTENTFVLEKTRDYYGSSLQALSTPFHFYFGLVAGKSGLDKFIDQFGPKGAFPSAE